MKISPSTRRRRARSAGLALAIVAASLSAPGLTTAAGRGVLRPHPPSPSAADGLSLPPGSYASNQVVVAYGSSSAQPQVVQLPAGQTVAHALLLLRAQPGVAYAVPDLVAHAAGDWIPNDPGPEGHPEGWEHTQWNFLGAAGVDAPRGWSNLIGEERPGARGVVIAILDTGVAYRDWGRFARSPDFARTRFVAPCDLVAHGLTTTGACADPYALDREGHGTFVAGTVAEATNNGIGLTGLAYDASIMPVRVLDAHGSGYASTIARGIRWAVNHDARVINLSLQFTFGTSADQIPEIISAINYAYRHGVVVVAAAGNDSTGQLAYPAADPQTISVGATTADGCRARYSDYGNGLDLVAPGGGDDASLSQSNCHPGRSLPSIYQMTLVPGQTAQFGYPGGYTGTSMSTAHVAAIAAQVIASGVIGQRPTPAAILNRLERTARPLGGTQPNYYYGYGLVQSGAATESASGGTGP